MLTFDNAAAFVALAAMEIVLGVDNLVFIAVITNRLPAAAQRTARRIGLGLALGMRILLLLAISWIMRLTTPLFDVLGRDVSGRDLILLGGGVFLIVKATWEIHHKLEARAEKHVAGAAAGLGAVVVQIVLLDLVFSLDSVITAVGMVDSIPIMVAAMVVAMIVMVASVNALGRFIERHPSVTMLALSFLLLIGVMLIAEGLGTHVSKGYIYTAMAFSLFVEALNITYRRRAARRA